MSTNAQQPAGRILAVDVGRVRVGLAVSDPDRLIASPLTTYVRQSSAQDAGYYAALVNEENVRHIVVGLPVHLDGREGDKARESRDYGAWLAKITGLPVAFYDERFSTVEAEKALWSAGLTHRRRKDRRDRVAAQIFLQAYLDAGCPAEQTPGALDD